MQCFLQGAVVWLDLIILRAHQGLCATTNQETEESLMHTDEYEISINRELNHCLHVVNTTRANLEQRTRRYGMGYEQAVMAVGENRLQISAKELARWQDDIEALPQWEQRLKEYREALAVMRISAS